MRVYGYLLLLYPPRFRAEFMEEIREIFLKITLEAEQGGALWLVRISLRELIALVISIFHERIDELGSLFGKLMSLENGRWLVSNKVSKISKLFIIWIVANILGIGAVAALPLVFPQLMSIDNEVLAIFIVSIPIGLAQWLALRIFSRTSILWVLTIPVGLGLYFLVLNIIPGDLRTIVDDESIMVLAGGYFFIGLLVGLLQWLMLRGQFSRSWLWVISSPVALGLSLWIVLATDLINQSGFLALVAAILIYTVTTGLVLSWLIAKQDQTMTNLPYQPGRSMD
jgi:hypothetical protein